MTQCLSVNRLQKSENGFIVAQGAQLANKENLTDKFNENFWDGDENSRSFCCILSLSLRHFLDFYSECVSFPSPWSFPYVSPLLFSTRPLILTASSRVPSWHADIVISVIIYLLMQTWPCPRYAVRQNIHTVVTVRPIKNEIGGT